MRLLFDQNLSRRLVRLLDTEFPGSHHVSDLGLETATDQAIWDYAADHGYVIVSKDSDFRQLAFLHGPPPKAIWVRLGNASTRDVVGVLSDCSSVISNFGDSKRGDPPRDPLSRSQGPPPPRPRLGDNAPIPARPALR